MAFESIIGQVRVKRFFGKILGSGRVSHAYLFVGAKGTGKEAMALEVARLLLHPDTKTSAQEADVSAARVTKLTHPDVEFLFPAPAKVKEEDRARVVASIAANPYLRVEPWANPSISIDRIREIRRKSSFKSYEGRGRVVILTDCERMTTEASNALLKLLEEPPDKMHLLMISSRPSMLLPTITSRCQVVKFDPLSAQEIEDALIRQLAADADKARLSARLANGSFRKAVELLDEDLEQMQDLALALFRTAVQDEFKQISHVDDILKRYNRDQRRMRDLLMHLTIWLRDAVLVRETGECLQQRLIHRGQLDVLQRFTQRFPNADLHAAVLEVERSFELMDRNVQVQLILIVLLNRLRALLRR